MARYVFSNGTHVGAEGYAFAGFDELGGEATEATHESVLGMPMQPIVRSIFEALAPGERHRAATGNYYLRIW